MQLRLQIHGLRHLRTLMALAVVIATSACETTMQAYQGDPRPKEEISVVKRYTHQGFLIQHRTWIVSFDEQKVDIFTSNIETLPGQHSAIAEYSMHFALPPCMMFGGCYEKKVPILFTTLAGHEYRIPGERKDGRIWVWVEDLTTDEVVAGGKPPFSLD